MDSAAVPAIMTDTKTRPHSEQPLQRTLRWFETLARHSDVVVLVFNSSSDCIFESGSIEGVLGQDTAPSSWADFVSRVHETDR